MPDQALFLSAGILVKCQTQYSSSLTKEYEI
jgi:hypothetical protein